MIRIAIAQLLAAVLFCSLASPLISAQEAKSDVRYFAYPVKLLSEKLKPLEESKGNAAALIEVQKWLKAGIEHQAIYDFEGWQYFGLTNYEQAAASFNRSLKIDPAYADSLLGRGLSYYRLSKFEKALPDFQAMKPSATRSKMIGACYLELGRPIGAINFIQDWRDLAEEEGLTSQLSDSEYHLAMAWELVNARDLSVEHITRALKHDATADLYLTRAKYLQRQGKYDEAQADIDKAIQAAESPEFYKISKFKYLRGATRLQAAIDYAKQLLVEYPDNDELKTILSPEIETLEKRVAAGEKAPVLAGPDVHKQNYNKAIAEERSTAAVMHASLLITQGDTSYHQKRAEALFNLRMARHMLYDLDAAIAAGKENGVVHSLRAFSLDNQPYPDSKEIIEACSRAFKMGLQLRSDYLLRAKHYRNTQQYDKAIADLNTVLGKRLDDSQKAACKAQLKELNSLASAQKHFAPFLQSDADLLALTKPMIPTPEIIAKVYQGALAKNFSQEIGKLANDTNNFVVSRQRDQTTIKLHAATTEQLQNTEQFPDDFPRGYRKAAKFLQPGCTFIRVRFLEPGKTSGMSYASFVEVDGQWYWFPKPWRFLSESP